MEQTREVGGRWWLQREKTRKAKAMKVQKITDIQYISSFVCERSHSALSNQADIHSALESCFFSVRGEATKGLYSALILNSQGYLDKCHSVRSNAHLPTLFSYFNLEECWAQAAHQQQTQGQEINLFLCPLAAVPHLFQNLSAISTFHCFDWFSKLKRKPRWWLQVQSTKQLPWAFFLPGFFFVWFLNDCH